MRPRDVIPLLRAAIKQRLALLLTGAPGIGKTMLEHQAAALENALNFILHPSISDPTDAKGFPFIIDGVAQFVPFDELKRVYDAVAAEKLCALFLDDLGQASPATQASYMGLMDKLQGKCAVIAATNRRTDRAGVQGLLEPVKSRFISIINVDVNPDDWCDWCVRTNQPVELIAFMRFRPDLLHDFKPQLDLVNSPCPRTWAAAGKILTLSNGNGRLPPALEFEALKGAVGEGAAIEFIAFLKIYRELPSLDGILLDPDSGNLPKDPATLYAVSTGLASRANANNFDRIARYAKRLHDGDRGEFAALILRDSVHRDNLEKRKDKDKIANTAAFIKLISTDLGRSIAGEEV